MTSTSHTPRSARLSPPSSARPRRTARGGTRRSRLESRSPVQNNGSPQTPSDAEIAMENKYKARFDFAQRQWEAKTRALQKELADVQTALTQKSLKSPSPPKEIERQADGRTRLELETVSALEAKLAAAEQRATSAEKKMVTDSSQRVVSERERRAVEDTQKSVEM